MGEGEILKTQQRLHAASRALTLIATLVFWWRSGGELELVGVSQRHSIEPTDAALLETGTPQQLC